MLSRLSRLILSFSAGSFLLFGNSAHAQFQAYSENFDSDNSANWLAYPASGGVHAADFFFDYSTVGVPPAPHSVGGTTRGLKLVANTDVASQVLSGISASPIGLNLQGDYEVRFDMWCNYNGPLVGGGSGSTQITGGGIGSANTKANYAGSADGIFFATTPDGGSSADFRIYAPAKQASYVDGDPVYPVGTTKNNTSPYWATNFPGGLTAPAAQVALFPQQTGTNANGTLSFKWREVVIRKAGNGVTFSIDGVLIGTVDYAASGASGGNILFMQSDINATASTDPNATSLLFGLFDNIRVTNLASIVSAAVTYPDASETGPNPATFTITRNEPDLSQARVINISFGGTATNGVDFQTVPSTVTIPAGATSVDVLVTPIDDSVAEPTETVVLNLLPGTGYGVGAPSSVTAFISDNEAPVVSIEAVTGLNAMYERITEDYARFRIVRLGDINAAGFDVNLTYSGVAQAGTDFASLPSVRIEPGETNKTFEIKPLDDKALEGSETFTVALAAGTGYKVGTANTSATGTIRDDETPAETVLFSENFNTDKSSEWTMLFGSQNGVDDYRYFFSHDYANSTYFPAVPPAPHSSGDTLGLYLTVNKDEGSDYGGAGINVYPKGKSFSGDYAVRFDMYLMVGGTASTTEYALMGINHSGTKTNWFRNSTTPTAGIPGGSFDGLFFGVESDAAALGDYALYSSPTTTGNNPTALNAGVSASTMKGTFKVPPYSYSGAPGVLHDSVTPTWSDVEISKIGSVVALKINGTEIMRYTNSTTYTVGNIMLGYTDAYDSIMSGPSGVIYDNLRVVSLTQPKVVTTGIQKVGNNIEISFTYTSDDPVTSFGVQSAATAQGGYATDATAVITRVNAGAFKAVIPATGTARFYRVMHN